MKIVDTDILVDYSREFPKAIQYLENEIINDTLSISVITAIELIYSLEMADAFIAASAIHYKAEW